MPRRSRGRQSGEAPDELLTVAGEAVAALVKFRRGDEDDEDDADFDADEETDEEEWDEDEEDEDLEQEDFDELDF